MNINLRSTSVLGEVTRLASMTGSLVLSLIMVLIFNMRIVVTAANDIAEENNISREVTRTSESQVVMTNTLVTVVTHQPKSFSPTKIVASLM